MEIVLDQIHVLVKKDGVAQGAEKVSKRLVCVRTCMYACEYVCMCDIHMYTHECTHTCMYSKYLVIVSDLIMIQVCVKLTFKASVFIT